MNFEKLISEVIYKAVRSSGSGGQHINKVATKVELYFNIDKSQFLLEEEKLKLRLFFKSRLTKDGNLVLTCAETRSQIRNKDIVTNRFLKLIREGLHEEKKRKPTKVSKAMKEKRLASKRKQSEKKAQRKPPNVD